MKALLLTVAEGPQSATVCDVPTPEPKAGEVRVKLKAASLNHRDLWISRGLYPGMKLPCTLGADGAGVVEAVGAGVDRAMLGREAVLYPALNWGNNPEFPSRDFALLGMPHPGTIAEYICVPAESAVAKPGTLSFEEAACLPTAGVTAWRALTIKVRIKPGDKVLVTGIGGGVAVWALKFALAMGAQVFVTSGSESKLDQARAMGAADGVNYKEEKWGKRLGQMTGGIDVVVDGAPTDAIDQYLRCLNSGGRVVIYGSTGGQNVQFTATGLFLRHASIIGTAMGTVDDFKAMVGFIDKHSMKPVIEKTFTLADAGSALQYFQDSHQLGKVVVAMP